MTGTSGFHVFGWALAGVAVFSLSLASPAGAPSESQPQTEQLRLTWVVKGKMRVLVPGEYDPDDEDWYARGCEFGVESEPGGNARQAQSVARERQTEMEAFDRGRAKVTRLTLAGTPFTRIEAASRDQLWIEQVAHSGDGVLIMQVTCMPPAEGRLLAERFLNSPEPIEIETLISRASAHTDAGEFAKAYPLAARAAVLAPFNTEGWFLKGQAGYFTALESVTPAERPTGGFTEAVADLDRALELALPEQRQAILFTRAWANFAAGHLDQAHDDAESVVLGAGKTSAETPYFALLAHFARGREPGPFGYWTDLCVLTCIASWPTPVHRYLVGLRPDAEAVKEGLVSSIAPEALMRQATTDDERAEAAFYIGLDLFMTPGARQRARPWLKQAAGHANPKLFERTLAKVYLHALDRQAP